jgi:hypothetical protein
MLGKSKVFELLFDNAANDLLVRVSFAKIFSRARVSEPRSQNVSCHHFSYLKTHLQADVSICHAKALRPSACLQSAKLIHGLLG